MGLFISYGLLHLKKNQRIENHLVHMCSNGMPFFL